MTIPGDYWMTADKQAKVSIEVWKFEQIGRMFFDLSVWKS